MNAPDPAKPRIDTPSRKGQPDPDEPVTFDLMPDEPATRPARPARWSADACEMVVTSRREKPLFGS